MYIGIHIYVYIYIGVYIHRYVYIYMYDHRVFSPIYIFNIVYVCRMIQMPQPLPAELPLLPIRTYLYVCVKVRLSF